MDYYINHKYASVVYFPLLGLSPNVSWLTLPHLDKIGSYVITRDNIRAKVRGYEERPITEFEKEIYETYNVSAWDFLKRWVEKMPEISSIYFLKLELTKD